MGSGSIRARVRAEMIAEIKAIARRHLATDGANLSLRAVAREMGMVSSAVYRYFPSRDDLLTALIVDAYNAVGDAAQTGEAAVADRADLRGRLLATARAIRAWGLSSPAEYALIYGSPVPGYSGNDETTAAALRTALVLAGILSDAAVAGAAGAPVAIGEDLAADLRRAADVVAPGLPEDVLMRGMISWIHLFGAVSFELFGQLNNVIGDRAAFFDAQMHAMADLIGLPGPG